MLGAFSLGAAVDFRTGRRARPRILNPLFPEFPAIARAVVTDVKAVPVTSTDRGLCRPTQERTGLAFEPEADTGRLQNTSTCHRRFSG